MFFYVKEAVGINRINELSRKSKTEGLSEEEKAEQKELRVKYINSFKESSYYNKLTTFLTLLSERLNAKYKIEFKI